MIGGIIGATYFPCRLLDHPKVGEPAGQEGFRPQDLLNRRHFNEIQLGQFVSVQNDGSEIWGAAFWQIRELLGLKDADRLLAKTWQAFGREIVRRRVSTSVLSKACLRIQRALAIDRRWRPFTPYLRGAESTRRVGANSPTTRIVES